jgi:molecular chaperone Hsp33
VTQLAATVKPEELQKLDADRLLYRLFNEEEIRLFEAQALNFQCTCSRERTAGAIKAMQKEEALEIVAEEGDINVECQFCKEEYVFDKVDVEVLFHASHNGTEGIQS